MTKLLTQNLLKIYKRREVVKNVSIEIELNTTVGLLGPNGAGKTTSFYMIVGFIKPTAGAIFFDNKDITKLEMYKRARLGIGYLPQESSVFRKLTVEDNIKALLELTQLSKKAQREECDKLLEEFNLTNIRKNYGFQLSGGERRRLEIARALVNNPKFLLLDEPFAGVDPIRVQDIQNIILHLKKRGLGILITDHNVRETLSIVDKAYLINSGEILIEGAAEELIEDERAKKLYLGENFKL